MPEKSQRQIRILLADDHFVVRCGLAASLEEEPDLKVVAQAATGKEACSLFRQHKPDLAIIDLHIPDLDGVAITQAIRSEFPQAHVLILTVNEGEEYVHRSVEAGALGYCSKAASREELLDAVRSVSNGEEWLSAQTKRLLEQRRQRPELTDRELQVLGAVVRGKLNKEIADELGIAEITVKQHVSSVLRKLSVQDRTQAATAAIARGLVQP